MTWCLQCGATSRPEVAIGVDEDGEPACGLHADKSKGTPMLRSLPRPVPLAPQPVASRAIAPVKEKPVMQRAKPTFAAKTCACGCGEQFNPAGPRSIYKDGHKPGAAPMSPPIKIKLKRKPVQASAIRGGASDPKQSASPLAQLKAELLEKLAAIEVVEKLLAG